VTLGFEIPGRWFKCDLNAQIGLAVNFTPRMTPGQLYIRRVLDAPHPFLLLLLLPPRVLVAARSEAFRRRRLCLSAADCCDFFLVFFCADLLLLRDFLGDYYAHGDAE
jgi:hypothetical protein